MFRPDPIIPLSHVWYHFILLSYTDILVRSLVLYFDQFGILPKQIHLLDEQEYTVVFDEDVVPAILRLNVN